MPQYRLPAKVVEDTDTEETGTDDANTKTNLPGLPDQMHVHLYPSAIKAFPEPSRQRSELLAGLLHPFWHPRPQCCSQQSHHDQIQRESTKKRYSCASRVLFMGYARGTGGEKGNDDNTHRCAPGVGYTQPPPLGCEKPPPENRQNGGQRARGRAGLEPKWRHVAHVIRRRL